MPTKKTVETYWMFGFAGQVSEEFASENPSETYKLTEIRYGN